MYGSLLRAHFLSFCIYLFIFTQDRDSYWKMMHKYIGSDVTSMVTLPVLIFEPMTMVQKVAEVCAISMKTALSIGFMLFSL